MKYLELYIAWALTSGFVLRFRFFTCASLRHVTAGIGLNGSSFSRFRTRYRWTFVPLFDSWLFLSHKSFKEVTFALLLLRPDTRVGDIVQIRMDQIGMYLSGTAMTALGYQV